MNTNINANTSTRAWLWKRLMAGLVLVLGCSANVCSGEIIGDISVNPEPVEIFQRSVHGYVEYRIELANSSPKKEHVVSLVYPRQSYNQPGSIRQIKKSVVLRPGAQVTVSFFQPPIRLEGSQDVGIEIDGREPRNYTVTLGRQEHGKHDYYGSEKACILVGRGVSGDIQRSAEAAFPRKGNKLSGSRYGMVSPLGILDSFEIKRSESNTNRWSGNWLGYSRYDCVVLTGRELTRAPGQVQAAIIRYVECGGTLAVVGQWQVPEEWSAKDLSSGLAFPKSKWQVMEDLSTKESVQNEATVYYAGFGECYLIPNSDVMAWSGQLWNELRSGWETTYQPWKNISSVEEANKQFEVVDTLSIPARGLFVLMLLFALLIGPVNILFYSRKGKRMRLLWTVPLLSLLSGASVFAYSLLSEGVTGKVRLEGITILDEKAHRATTLGWLGYYCPLTPGEGLHFDIDSELTPQIADQGWNRSGRSRTINWTQGQHLESGWVAARVPAHFMLRRTETRRERLAVRYDQEGNISVVNSLGADIVKLWLADKKGTIYTGENITAGVTQELQAGPRAGGEIDSLREQYRKGWLRTIKSISTKNGNAEHLLRPGRYIALLEDTPFMEKGLDKVKVKKSKTVVYGIME